ncbi:MAG: hypothetical protein U0263_09505 [Polyangiaceae bacterium]
MKKAAVVLVLLGLVACDKKEAAPTTASTGAAAKPAASAAPAATSAAPTASAAPAPSASAGEKAEKEEAAEPEEQEGLEKGEVVVGYLQDLKDEGQCAALPAPEKDKAKYDEKKLEEVAKAMKAKVVKSCPSEGVQGTCRTMGMLVNYTAPKYTIESAQKHCKQNRGKWFD